jgi:hypothetical protein
MRRHSRNDQIKRAIATGILATVPMALLGCQENRYASQRPPPAREIESAAAGKASASAAPAPSPLNATVEVAGLRVRFVAQRECGSPEPGIPGAGRRLWAAEFDITNVSEEPRAVNPFHITLEDERRARYVTSLVGCAPLLPARLLAPKEHARGFVPFELPNPTSRVQLTFRSPNPKPVEAIARFVAEL